MNFSDVRTYVKGLLTKSFANKTVLDKLSEDDNGKINYNNNPIQDSYSKEEFDEILKSDYKQIFDKDSNVELLDAPVSFTGTKTTTVGTGISTVFNQSIPLSQSIKDFDYLIVTFSHYYLNTPNNTDVRRNFPAILIPIKSIVYNNADKYNTSLASDKSMICSTLQQGTSSSDAYGAYNFSVHYWFKDEKQCVFYNIINPLGYDVTITIESIVGTKFHSTEIYKETSVLNTLTNYSLEERCIGSWINGKPLYERTFKLDDCSSNSQSTIMIDNYSEIETYVKIFGSAKDIGGVSIPLPLAHFISVGAIYVDIYNQSIRIMTGSGNAATNIYITIQYTKTTDEENSFTPDMLSTDEIDDTITDEDIENLMTQIKEG